MVDLSHKSYPRSSRYDSDWLLSLDMGPNPLWLLEDLLEDIAIEPGSRVLDIGCGRGATAVFLAKELDVDVVAVDLWVPAPDIQAVAADAGVGDAVQAINANVHDLPFPDSDFDAIICIDAWEYFGTDDHLLPKVLRVLRPGGAIGMVTPSMHRDVREIGHIPEHIRAAVGWEALAWRSPDWWQQQWSLTGLVEEVRARAATTGWSDWLRWVSAATGSNDSDNAVIDMLRADKGELLTFAIVSALRRV